MLVNSPKINQINLYNILFIHMYICTYFNVFLQIENTHWWDLNPDWSYTILKFLSL